MAVGAIILSLVFISVYHLYHKQNPAEQLASKASRIDIVSRMRIALASASEAEKSAVLAVTDGESRTFAEQARAAAAEVEKGRRELEQRLETGGTQTERDLFGQFSEFFLELQRIDRELLDLAVRNTNVKAYHLAFGPAASALDEMNAVLSRLVSSNAGSPEEKQVMSLAYGAEIAGLRIQTLLFPHIAEESGRRMDEMEALMSKEDGQIRRNLADSGGISADEGKDRSGKCGGMLYPVRQDQVPNPRSFA